LLVRLLSEQTSRVRQEFLAQFRIDEDVIDLRLVNSNHLLVDINQYLVHDRPSDRVRTKRC